MAASYVIGVLRVKVRGGYLEEGVYHHVPDLQYGVFPTRLKAKAAFMRMLEPDTRS